MPGCTVPNCSNSSQKGFKLYNFPRDAERNRKWVLNCGREPGWKATRHTSICEVHFDENQFELHRADGLRKLKPYAVPTIFNTDNKKKVYGRSKKVPLHELNDGIRIEAVTSLSDTTATNDLNQVTVLGEKSNGDTSENESVVPKRKSARISRRGRVKWTNLYRKGYQTATTQAQKTRKELMKTCPKEVRIVVERLGQLPEQSVSKEASSSSSKRKVQTKSHSKMSPRISAEACRKRVKMEEDVESLMRFGDGTQQPGDEEDGGNGGGGKGNCAICNKYIDNGTLLDSVTLTSKMQFHQKLTRLSSGEHGLVVGEGGVLCSVCTRLLNYMDRIEVELSMLKTAILNCMRKKHVMEQNTCRMVQNKHEPPDEGVEMKVTLPNSKNKQEEHEVVADHWEQTDDHHGTDEPEAVSDLQQDSLEQSDLSPNQAKGTKTEHEIISKQYKCSICSFKTSFKSVIIFHLRQHVKHTFRCDFCNITIPTNSEQMMQMLAPRIHFDKTVLLYPTGVKATVPGNSALSDMDSDPAVVSETERPTDFNSVEEICTGISASHSAPTDVRESHTNSLSETHIQILANSDEVDIGNSSMEILSDSIENTLTDNPSECERDVPVVERYEVT